MTLTKEFFKPVYKTTAAGNTRDLCVASQPCSLGLSLLNVYFTDFDSHNVLGTHSVKLIL